MSKPILYYPDGLAGAALLLMRIAYGLVAWPAFERARPEAAGGWVAVPAVIVALALAAGLSTRAAALSLSAVLGVAALSARGDSLLLLLASAGGVAAIAALGPGAYSIDAHWFGRRVIRLEPRSPDRGIHD